MLKNCHNNTEYSKYDYDIYASSCVLKRNKDLRINLQDLPHLNAYDHTTMNTPVLVWSPKLSTVGPGQYLDGWPPGNTWCCRLLFPSCNTTLFEFSFSFLQHVPLMFAFFAIFTWSILSIILPKIWFTRAIWNQCGKERKRGSRYNMDQQQIEKWFRTI